MGFAGRDLRLSADTRALPWLLSHLRRLAQILGRIRDLSQEGAYPVFSAETTDGREAEYITDRLAPKVPRWGKLLASFLLIIAVAYLVAGQRVAHP